MFTPSSESCSGQRRIITDLDTVLIPGVRPAPTKKRPRKGSTVNAGATTRRIVLTTVILYGATLLAVFATVYGYRSVGTWIVNHGSWDRIVHNFAHPIASVKPLSGGGHWYTSDGNPWWENLLGHPLVWYMVAMVVRMRGHGHVSTFIQAEIHSIVWEYAYEGCYTRPSGVDLIMNTAGLFIGIFAFDAFLRMKASPPAPVRVLSHLVNPYRGPWQLIEHVCRRLRGRAR